MYSVKSISFLPYEPYDYSGARMYLPCKGLFLRDGLLTNCTVGSIRICYRGRDIAPYKLEEMVGTISKELILIVEDNTVYFWFKGHGYIVSCYYIEDIYLCVIKNQKVKSYIRTLYPDTINIILDQPISHKDFLRYMIG